VVAHADHARVVGRAEPDEHVGARRARQPRDEPVHGLRRELAPAAGAVRQRGEGDSHSGIWSRTAMPARTYTAEEVDVAVARLNEPGRLRHAEEVVTHAAPSLQRVLDEALHEGGFFG